MQSNFEIAKAEASPKLKKPITRIRSCKNLPMKLRFQLSALINLILLLPSHSARAKSDLLSDKDALLDFANGVPHVRKLNWNDTNPLCTSWIGITCLKDGTRVAGVHLPGVGLFGPIPANTIGKLDALRVLSLRSNYLTGDLPSDVLSLPSLQSLYLQRNNFSGGIPLFLSPRLTVVDLSSNSLTGGIPSALAELKRLTVLNLEYNSFSGNVPNLDIQSLMLLNLSYNSLNGSIPQSLHKFPSSSFLGNALLCGPPLTTNCSTTSSSSSSSSSQIPAAAKSRNKLSAGSIAAITVGCLSLVCLASAFMFFVCLKKKKKKGGGDGAARVIKVKTSDNGKTENLKSEDFGSGVQGAEKIKLTVFEGCTFSFDLEDLLRASAEVLGKGTNGTTYKAILDESTTVAVKRLKEVGVGKKEFDQHMELVSRLNRHPNVVPLLAYYCSKDEKLLVYEYMPASSLSAALHGNREMGGGAVLDWESRLNIALGAARGLAHIHSEGGAKFVHGNIKASNVLLRGGLDGCVSDLGLSPLVGCTEVKYRVAGYRAPEVIEARRAATQKSDVYSFGVLLLEMLTGKSPVRYDEVVDLPRWVRSVVREEWTAEVFDMELIKHQSNVEEELVQMLQIAFCCVAKAAESRPPMEEVAGMIERIRHPEVDNRPSSEDRSKEDNVQTP